MNICLVSANDVMEHFAFPGNIDFAADDQITEKVIDVSRTHIPLNALMIPLKRVKLRGVVV